MKKIVQRLSLGFLFCLALCLCFAPAGYAEAELVDAGSCGASGANVSWMLFSDGELTVTGTGDMRSCYRSQPWAAYSDEIRAVTIGSGVTRIGMDAFSGCKNLRTVSIPNSVTAIDTLAFTGSGLTEVTIPGSVTSIPSEVFKNCKSLKTARLNYGVATIGSYAFSSSGLTSVTIPGSVTTIGANAFYQSSLNEVTIPGSVETIGKGAFSSTKLTSVTINSGVTSIGSQAFEYCYHLTSVSIPNTVTQIGDNAFHSCDSLSSITIPGSVESIGSQAFYFCKSLKNVTVPASVTSIGTNAFGACDGITSAGPIGGAYDYQFGWNNAIPNNAFQYCRMLKSITIPNSVNSIDERAFYNCPELESLTIPTSMRSIGVNAFYGCSSLHHVYYNSTQAKWNQITVESGNTALQNATLHLSSQPPATYTVSYSADGGNGIPESQIKEYGTALTLSTAVPTRENDEADSFTVILDANGGTVSPTSMTAARSNTYSFNSWNTDEQGMRASYAPGASYTAEADAVLYAQWNYGIITESLNLPTPTHEKYNFLGWGTDSDAIEGITGEYVPKGNVTLYAVWDIETYDVTYDANGGTNAPSAQRKKLDIDLVLRSDLPERAASTDQPYVITLNANGGSVTPNTLTPTRTTSYTFRTWNTEQDGSGTSYSPGSSFSDNAALTLYAQWDSEASIESVELPELSRAGYSFLGWGSSSDAASGITGSYTPTADVTLYAIWKPDRYAVTYNANGGTDAPKPQIKLHGSALTLSSAEPTHESTEVGSYTVTLDAKGGTVSTSSLTAARTKNYTFHIWNTASNGSGTDYAPGASYTGNAPLTLYAMWKTNTNTSAVTLPVPTREGYTFKGWSAQATASSGITGSYTPTESKTLYAIWRPNSGTCGNNLTWTLDGEGTLIISGSGSMSTNSSNWRDDWRNYKADIRSAIINEGVTSVGQYAFADCSSLSDISLPESLQNIGSYAFNNCSSLGTITIPESVQAIGSYAFYNTGINSVVLPEGITSINTCTFKSCSSLSSVTIPRSVNTIAGYAFYLVSDHLTVYYNGTEAEWNQISVDEGNELGNADKYYTYTIDYQANGGFGAPDRQKKITGEAVTLSNATPSHENSVGSYTVRLNYDGDGSSSVPLTSTVTTTYSFSSWNTQQDGHGTSYAPGSRYTANANLTLYAQWNSSTSIAEVTLPAPTRTGYSFMGWALDSSASSGVVGSYTPDGNVTLYAIWKPNTYTISYDANGGVGAPANQTKTQDIALTLSAAVPTRDNSSAGSYTVTLDANGGSVNPTSLTAKRTTGYTFRNWNTAINGSGTSYAPGARYTANASAVLYAQWNSSTTASPVTLPTPTRSGYSFMGWSSNSSASSGSVGSYTPGANVTLYAIWKPDTYIISYNANGGTGTPSSQIKEQDVPLTLSSVQPKKYYIIQYNAAGGTVSPASKNVNCTFDNWNSAVNGSGTSYASGGTYTINADATLYAQWTNPTAGTLAAPKRSGYVFDGWFTSATSGVRVTDSSTITGNMTVYAHWTESAANPYNLGEETYSFENYGDSDSAGGHCFGMSMTSAGYYNGLLDISRIGGNAGTPLYSFSPTSTVKKPICYYQSVQGSYSRDAIVAGGSFYLYRYNNIASDWREVVNYVSNHEYDGTGLLQIGFRKGLGGHAINFLRYENVNGQDRIYAYDNNFPTRETYFYQDSGGNVRQAPVQTFSGSIDCIALRDCRKYFNSTGDFDSTHALYMAKNAATVEGYSYTYMEGEFSEEEYVMYEIPADQDRVIIVPNRDYADFIYMDTEYSFGVITDETYGELKFASINEHGGTSDAVFRVFESDSGFAEPDFVLPSALTEIEESAFEGISAATVYIPDLCTSIGSYAFRNASVKQIRIPEACSIAENAFDGCARVKIFGTPGSPAEVYCDSHENCTFIPENRKVVLEMHVSCASLSPFEE